MLRPSYTELMDTINREQNVDTKITSRYTIVIAAAKRARQLIDGADQLVPADTDKAVSVAVNELYEGKLNITTVSSEDEVLDVNIAGQDAYEEEENNYPKDVEVEYSFEG